MAGVLRDRKERKSESPGDGLFRAQQSGEVTARWLKKVPPPARRVGGARKEVGRCLKGLTCFCMT